MLHKTDIDQGGGTGQETTPKQCQVMCKGLPGVTGPSGYSTLNEIEVLEQAVYIGQGTQQWFGLQITVGSLVLPSYLTWKKVSRNIGRSDQSQIVKCSIA